MRERSPGEHASQEDGAGEAAQAGVTEAPETAEAEPQPQVAAVESTTEVAEPAAPALPSFDLVRVEKSGETVVAGRAPPGSTVTVGSELIRFEGEGRVEAVVVATDDGEERRVADTVIVDLGTYPRDMLARMGAGLPVTATGSADQPITIRGEVGATPLIEMQTDKHNVIEVLRSRYLQISSIAFTGGSHGIRLIDSDFISIEDCEVYESGDVAISANAGGTYEGLVIRRNHIHHTNGAG